MKLFQIRKLVILQDDSRDGDGDGDDGDEGSDDDGPRRGGQDAAALLYPRANQQSPSEYWARRERRRRPGQLQLLFTTSHYVGSLRSTPHERRRSTVKERR